LGGGSITGPFLKPMSHLIHTEYLLNGRSSMDVRDVLRDSILSTRGAADAKRCQRRKFPVFFDAHCSKPTPVLSASFR